MVEAGEVLHQEQIPLSTLGSRSSFAINDELNAPANLEKNSANLWDCIKIIPGEYGGNVRVFQSKSDCNLSIPLFFGGNEGQMDKKTW